MLVLVPCTLPRCLSHQQYPASTLTTAWLSKEGRGVSVFSHSILEGVACCNYPAQRMILSNRYAHNGDLYPPTYEEYSGLVGPIIISNNDRLQSL